MSRERHRVVALLALVGLGLGGSWWLLDGEVRLPLQLGVHDMVLFALAAAVMELLPIRVAQARPAPTSLAVIGTAVLLGAGPAVAALVAVCAYLLACSLARRWPSPALLLRRAGGGWSLAGVAALGATLGPGRWIGDGAIGAAASIDPGAALAVAAAVLVGVPAVEALAAMEGGWRHALRRVGEEVDRHRLVGTVLATTATLGALVHPVLGLWTLPTMLLPLLAARFGLDRLGLGHLAYDQTIRAMSRLPEELGSVPAGHGERVAELAREVAFELGLDATTVADTVRAAHLHELGRIKLERESPALDHEVARAGAEVLAEVGDLDRVAEIVANQAQLLGGPPDVDSLPARIIVACCDLDISVSDPGDQQQRDDAVVGLVRHPGDVEVVAALVRVLDRAAGREPVR